MPFRKFWFYTTAVAVLSGILYNSWPLGYWLNPAVAKGSLASGLEGTGQPYNWVFVGGDIVSSLLIMGVAVWLWQRLRSEVHGVLFAAILASVMVFGVGTIADALLPESCLPGTAGCADWQHNGLLLAHGVVSILASVALFVALALAWWHRRSSKLLTALLVGYVIFGAISLVEALSPTPDGNWSQQYYITLCSIWLAFIPYAVYLAFVRTTSRRKN